METTDGHRPLTSYSRSGGCGCKLSPVELVRVMSAFRSHPAFRSEAVVVGVGTSDDAGVLRLPGGQLLLHTVDFFTPLVDDPYQWGRIAATNALSDVYAMGGTPLSALQLVGWPRDELGWDVLERVLRGGADVVAAAGTVIVGGHSIVDDEPKYGLAVTGLVAEAALTTNAAARPGDDLVLSKPLGVGVVAAAIKRALAPDDIVAAAIDVMTTLNAGAAEAGASVGVRAVTDVTGFGLLGHLREMVAASGVSAIVDTSAVPILPGVLELLDCGCFSGGSQRNLEAVEDILDRGKVDDRVVRVLADAQTSGGLLLAVPRDRSWDLVAALAARGAPAASVIGEIVEGPCRIGLR